MDQNARYFWFCLCQKFQSRRIRRSAFGGGFIYKTINARVVFKSQKGMEIET